MNYKGLRCAIIEYELFHDQIIPSYVYALNKLGIAVDIYFTDQSIKNNVFYYDNQLRYRIFRSEGNWAFLRERLLKYRNYDFIFLNSLDPPVRVNTLERLSLIRNEKLPVIGVIHESNKISPSVLDFCKGKNNYPLVLAENIAKQFYEDHKINVHWIPTVYLGDNIKKKHISEKTVFCLPGLLSPDRKEYTQLVDAMEKLDREEKNDFLVYFVGRSYMERSKKFKEMLTEKNLIKYCRFTDGFIDYKKFYRLVANSDFIMCFIDRERETGKFFSNYKITSSALSAIGLNVIPIIHKNLVSLYGLENASISYNDDFAGGMKIAMNMRESERMIMKNNLNKRKEIILAISVRQMHNIIDDIFT